MFNAEEIERYIPHRPPFRLIDRILSIEEGVCATSLREVSEEDPLLAGHFPGYPIMPGVLIVETMAQTANFLVAYSDRDRLEEEGETRHFLGMIRKMHFPSSARPGDEIITEVKVIKLFTTMGIMDCVSSVGDRIVARGQLMFGAAREG